MSGAGFFVLYRLNQRSFTSAPELAAFEGSVSMSPPDFFQAQLLRGKIVLLRL